MLQNLFGDIALDLNIKNILKKLTSLSFTPQSELRASVTGSVSFVTNQSIGTVATRNIGLGDMGKTSTAQLVSYQGFHTGVGRNFIR